MRLVLILWLVPGALLGAAFATLVFIAFEQDTVLLECPTQYEIPIERVSPNDKEVYSL
jgi:hypothetical protein